MTRISGDWLTAAATQTVCRALSEAGGAVHFVGGCVRNALLGVPVSDIDLSTDLHPDRVIALAAVAGIKAVPTGIEHGTVTLVVDAVPYEVTTYRRDVETDGRRAVVAFSGRMEDDAMRRDFTMNALYADPNGLVLDPLGGLPDLLARRVRFVGNAADRLAEDYLRALRFFRFHAWYGDPEGGLEADALAAIAACPEKVATLSRERITAELKKLLAAPDPTVAVAAMAQTGLLAHLLPGADPCALGPMVHMETALERAPHPMARLAAIAPETAPDHLRLSRAEADAFMTFFHAGRDMTPPAILGYQLGEDRGLAALALRAALREQMVAPGDVTGLKRGAQARFPVTARDLMPQFSGPALGQALKNLEEHWIAHDFQPSRADLLTRLRQG